MSVENNTVEVKPKIKKGIKTNTLLLLLGVILILGIIILLVILLINSQNAKEEYANNINVTPTEQLVDNDEDEEILITELSDFLVICPSAYESTDNCKVKNEDNAFQDTIINNSYQFNKDIAFSTRNGKLIITKFEKNRYVKLQEYNLELKDVVDVNSFATDEYIYTYQTKLVRLDDIPLNPELNPGSEIPEYENDLIAVTVRYGINSTKIEELDRKEYFNVYGIGDIAGGSHWIHAVHEKNKDIYYHDPAGGGFFNSLIKFNWGNKQIKGYDVSGVVFNLISSDLKHFFYSSDKLYINDFNTENEVLKSNVDNNFGFGVFSIPNTKDYLISDYHFNSKTLDIYTYSNGLAVKKCSTNHQGGRFTTIFGKENAYVPNDKDSYYILDINDCSKDTININKDFELRHVFVDSK